MQITGTTKIVGIFGDPVSHSLSPGMQNAALEAAGIDAVYVPFHVAGQELAQAVGAVRALELVGVNVTVPHKEGVMPLLDEIDPDAALIGAVNTIVNRSGRLVGYNTDGIGFLASLRDDLDFDPAGRRVVLLGAGGAARAAIVALAGAGASSIAIVNRTADKAENLQLEFRKHFPDVRISVCPLPSSRLEQIVSDAELLVNTTTIGMHGESYPEPVVDLLNDNAVFYDMVYAPDLTPMQRSASERGLRFADGRGMLAGQGEASFRLWFGTHPPDKIMARHIGK